MTVGKKIKEAKFIFVIQATEEDQAIHSTEDLISVYPDNCTEKKVISLLKGGWYPVVLTEEQYLSLSFSMFSKGRSADYIWTEGVDGGPWEELHVLNEELTERFWKYIQWRRRKGKRI